MKSPLSDRQARFVHEYLIDQNASAAAGRAGYSDKTRGAQAALLMKNPAVRERIVIELADLYARLKLNAIEVLRMQIRAAYLDPAKLFDANQRAIPLVQLDEDTRGGLSVTYNLKDDGRQTLNVRQTPRHVALAVLQKRLDAFERMQQETFAYCDEDAESTTPATPAAPVQRGNVPRPFKLDIKLDEPEPTAPMTLAEADAVLGEAARALAPTPGASPPRRAEPSAASVSPEAAAAPALVPAPALDPDFDPDAPPSPHDPDYDFMKDPNALQGGRWVAWSQYQRKKKQREMEARPAQGYETAPPGMRVGPGRVVPSKENLPYNHPWLKENNRPEFAIGAGETYLD
jgi:phage terminase small subunit